MLRPLPPIHRPLPPMQRPFLAMLHAFAATLCEDVDAAHEESRGHHALHSVLFLVLTTPRQRRARTVPFRGRGNECVEMHPLLLAINRSFLGMHRPSQAMLHAFAATRCEDVDAVDEESRGHHALHSVLFPVLTTRRQRCGCAVPSRVRGSEHVGSSSARGTTRSAYVGMPRESLETPRGQPRRTTR
jgi:hypothetical protein